MGSIPATRTNSKLMNNNKSLLHKIVHSQFIRDRLIVFEIILALSLNLIIAIRSIVVVTPTTLLIEFRYSNLFGGGGLLSPASWSAGLLPMLFAVIVTAVFFVISNKFFNLERLVLARLVLFLLLVLLMLNMVINQVYLETLR